MAETPPEELEIATTVNGAPVRRRIAARQHLAYFLRDELGLTGTHLGCEHGVCGACTVVVDGRIVRGCLTLAAQVDGATVETIEGLSERGALTALQAAFAARNAAQCGFCTAGMLLTARELVAAGRTCTREEIRAFLSGNLCRCTGYHAIVDAVEAVLNGAAR
ncbi:MAG: (2Fe-2S)-binding protein [Alphaproteobacteria bacterium]|nr:(2Fe-2S)-binding protein [Alphaproteobacteria bacterium]